MFTVDKTLKYIDHSDKKMLSILKSSNQPLIAAADRPAEPTESFICSYRNSKKKIETYIMLHLVKSGIRVFYASDKGEFSPDEFTDVEIDALEFLESMGFTMDNIGFQKLKDKEKDELFASLPIFKEPEEASIEAQNDEEEDFIRPDEMAQDLEDVLSEEDMQSIEQSSARAKEDSQEDLLDNIENAVEELPAFQENEASDEKALVDLQADKISAQESEESIKTMAEEKNEKSSPDVMELATPKRAQGDLTKIARIISSF